MSSRVEQTSGPPPTSKMTTKKASRLICSFMFFAFILGFFLGYNKISIFQIASDETGRNFMGIIKFEKLSFLKFLFEDLVEHRISLGRDLNIFV